MNDDNFFSGIFALGCAAIIAQIVAVALIVGGVIYIVSLLV